MRCCEDRAQTYPGKSVDDIPELKAILTEVTTDYKKWATTYTCSICGQRWIEEYVSRGHGEVPEVRKDQANNEEGLREALVEMIGLLDEFEVKNWRDYFEKALNILESDSLQAAKIVLNAYGGMGSFNDCTLGYNKADTPKGFSLSEKRIRFNELHSSLQRLATEINKAI